MPVDLTLAKKHARVLHDYEDDLLTQYAASAAAMVEQMTGKLLTRREVSQDFATFAPWLPLFWGPDPADLTVDYTDTDDAPQTIADARIVKDRLYSPSSASWPSIADNSVLTVTYTAGYETVPADLVAAQLLLIGHLYASREAVSDKPMQEVPLAVEALVQPYRGVYV